MSDFDFDTLETVSIQTIADDSDLSSLMRLIKVDPEALRGSEGPLGHRPSKMYLRRTVSNPKPTLSCSYGSQADYILATAGDTVITYADGTFCILPTGSPAQTPSVAPLAAPPEN